MIIFTSFHSITGLEISDLITFVPPLTIRKKNNKKYKVISLVSQNIVNMMKYG